MNTAVSLLKGAEIIKSIVNTLPENPGVYRMIGVDEKILYVGKAKNLKKRVISYTRVDQLPLRLKRMVSETLRMEIVTTYSEAEALLLENNLIKEYQPYYNILLKDDKSFPYILLTQDHPYPRIMKHRGPKTIKGDYFGPFASVGAVDETIETLTKIFQIRNCTNHFFESRSRPCLQYHIKRCSAPCVKKIEFEDYKDLVRQAVGYLKGKNDEVQKFWAEKMQIASNLLNFEEAALYRDKIKLLTHIQSKQKISVSGITDADVIGLCQIANHVCAQVFFFRQGQNYGTTSFFFKNEEDSTLEDVLSAFLGQFYQDRTPSSLVLLSHKPSQLSVLQEAFDLQFKKKISFVIPTKGIKKDLVSHAVTNAEGALKRRLAEKENFEKGMEELRIAFDLSKRPERIEVYDNSHLFGTNAYGVMIVANAQGFDKKAYRKFQIKSSNTSDDFAMMKEVLKRRFQRFLEGETGWQLPDLILIDGGLGQLNAALEVVNQLDIEGLSVIGISKGEDRNAGKEFFHQVGHPPFQFPLNHPTLHFLQRLRDESHRFAIGTHRAKREKTLTISRLDDVPGIGPLRKKRLLQHFGSAQDVSKASIDDLLMVQGIDIAVAKKIYAYFHEK